jgi:hypothetical protein
MGQAIAMGVVVFVFPLLVFWIFGALLLKVTGRAYTIELLRKIAKPEDRLPLYRRCQGYDVNAVHRHWMAFDPRALGNERLFLLVDLLFAVVYGAAFVISLGVARRGMTAALTSVWILGNACVVLTVIADWTENVFQLGQLDRYIRQGISGLQSAKIQIASYATQAKLVLFTLSVFCVLIVAIAVASRQ